MLTEREARRIGVNACIDKLGRSFVDKYEDNAVFSYGETDEGIYCYVGVSDKPRPEFYVPTPFHKGDIVTFGRQEVKFGNWGGCLDLEYYRDPLTGRARVPNAISSYLKGEMDLASLLTAYRAIMNEEMQRQERERYGGSRRKRKGRKSKSGHLQLHRIQRHPRAPAKPQLPIHSGRGGVFGVPK